MEFLADVILIVHFAFAAFIVLGWIAILVGASRGWRWVRAPAFRYAHLAAIVFVAAEALAGVVCPLTVLEDALRGHLHGTSFIGRWVARLLYYELPPWVFTTAYVTLAAGIAVTLWAIPPRSRRVTDSR
jgi:hypothetical protein